MQLLQTIILNQPYLLPCFNNELQLRLRLTLDLTKLFKLQKTELVKKKKKTKKPIWTPAAAKPQHNIEKQNISSRTLEASF